MTGDESLIPTEPAWWPRGADPAYVFEEANWGCDACRWLIICLWAEYNLVMMHTRQGQASLAEFPGGEVNA